MAHKPLHELLSKDQEPFVLKSYIDERRCQLKRSESRTHLQIKRRNPISENSIFPGNFCQNACFLSFHDSPDIRKSPLFDFSSPLKSPCRNSNSLLIHIPSRTANVLVEAALRIQKQSSSSKSKSPKKGMGLGFVGSILKRITPRKRNRKPELKGDEIRVSVKDILRWDSYDGRKLITEERREIPEIIEDLDAKRVSEMGFSCSSNSRLSSAWSESNEDKSEDLETSSSRSDDSEEMEFVVDERKNGDFSSCEKAFCSSPFQFGLQKSPSPGRRTPEFASPATSPSRRRKEVKENEEGSLSCVGKEYDEEEKEQFSPICVLDPPFKDDDGDDNDNDNDRHHDCDYEEEAEGDEDHDFELERSFAIVQRTKRQLLHKLRRFERLAELNPIDLEKRLSEEDEEEYEDENDDDDDDESVSPDNNEKSDDGLVREVLGNIRNTPGDMKRLVLDLVAEEARQEAVLDDREVVLRKVCRRFESWKEVESNTINMMVDSDFIREGDEWRRYKEQVRVTAVEIERAIFGFLMQELSDELVH